ncbi:hypothetical protein [Pseudomonas shirazica]|uniref:hypothetical protein n=1 Tax=Pseudomonas shirazica TaxID=1940636 RepID=UPI001C27CB31|nr:hypothetical protein [Pseudomonas shirazica]
MTDEQRRILSSRIVNEIFHQMFVAGNDEASLSGTIPTQGRIAVEELSRRIDGAIELCTEKLNRIS